MKNKDKNKRKRLIALTISGTFLVSFSALAGVFGSGLNKEVAPHQISSEARTFVNTITNNSLTDYWKNLDSTKLVSSEETLTNFINQNGAIFENLVASKNYIANSQINEIVSTAKTVDFQSNKETASKIKELFKTNVRKNAKTLYDWATSDISTSAEYVSRMNAINDVYPEFKTNMVDNYAQSLGVWSNPFYLNYDNQGNQIVDAPSGSWGDILTPLYLRKNYRKYFVNKLTPAYSSFLYNNLNQAFAHDVGWKSTIMGQTSDGVDTSAYPAIENKAKYMTTEMVNAVSWFSNGDDKFKARGVQDVLEYTKNETEDHWKKREEYIIAAAMIASPAAPIAAIAAAALSPTTWKSDYLVQDYFWDERGLISDKLVEQMYPTKPTSIFSNFPTKVDTLYETSATFRSLYNNTDTWNWNYTSPSHYMRKGIQFAHAFAESTGDTNGRLKAQADLEFLTDVYFDKFEGEWRKSIVDKQNNNGLIYFEDFINTKDGLFEQMDTEGMKLFQMALKDYIIDINGQANWQLYHFDGYNKRNGVKFLKLHERTPWEDYSVKKRELFFRTVAPIFSEQNKKTTFKKHLDKVWEKYGSELNTTINTKLESTKQDAEAEFNIVKNTLKDTLITPYTTENFKVDDFATDTLGQHTIPLKTNNRDVNFAIIPPNNPKSSGYGYDKNAQDVINAYLTRNIILKSFLDRDSKVAPLLRTKSPSALNAYVTSLFAKLQRTTFSIIEPIFNQFSTQTSLLLDEYLLKVKEGVSRDLTKEQYLEYTNDVLVQQKTKNKKLMDLDLNQVKLAEGFLLSILDVTRYDDPTGAYKTIFEMLDDNEQLHEAIQAESLKLARGY